jgi:hypothetical protein
VNSSADKTIYLAISDTSFGKEARPEQATKAPRRWRSRRQYLPDAAYQLFPRCQTASASNEIIHHLLSLDEFSVVDALMEGSFF